MTENHEAVAKAIGEMAGVLIVFLGLVTVIWAVSAFIFTLPYTWLQVFGASLLFNLLKNSIAQAFKK
jgi:disulfide bond formation protein DsbB